MISIVTWIWDDGFRTYTADHVNVLQRMIARHLSVPHRFICVTDNTSGFSPDVEVIETPVAAKHVAQYRSPEGARFPSCYRRLWMFSDEARALGERLMLLDVDLVVLRDLLPVIDHDEDFVGWRPYRDWGAQMRFGGGIYLLQAGSRTQVWDDFKGEESIRKARSKGYRGSDQAWISYKLGDTEPYWDRDAGIYSIRDFMTTPKDPPGDARIIQTNGPCKPWSDQGQQLEWIKDNWR